MYDFFKKSIDIFTKALLSIYIKIPDGFNAKVSFKDGIRIVDIIDLPFKVFTTDSLHTQRYYESKLYPLLLASFFSVYIESPDLLTIFLKESWIYKNGRQGLVIYTARQRDAESYRPKPFKFIGGNLESCR